MLNRPPAAHPPRAMGCCKSRAQDKPATAAPPVVEEKTAPCEEKPGEYLLLKEVFVRRELSLDSPQVGELKQGSSVTVTEIVNLADKKKVRGRVKEPAGWITIKDSVSGILWASCTHKTPDAAKLASGHALLAMSRLTMRLDEAMDSGCVTMVPEDEALEVVEVGEGRRIKVKNASGQVGWVSLKTEAGVFLLKEQVGTESGNVAERWVRGVRVPGDLLTGFYNAVKDEFADRNTSATTRWLEKSEVPEHVRVVLRPEIKPVAAAGTGPEVREAVRELAWRWGIQAARSSVADEGPAIVVHDAAMDAAALKIQSVHRGKEARKAVATKRDSKQDPGLQKEPTEHFDAAKDPDKDMISPPPDAEAPCLEEVLPPPLEMNPREVSNRPEPWCNVMMCCH